MSPSGGDTTVVLQPITWSPVKSARSSASAQHVWFDVWPGVYTAAIVSPGVSGTLSPSASATDGEKS